MQEINVNLVPALTPTSPKMLESDMWGTGFTEDIPNEIILTGRSGFNATMNGKYRKSHTHEGRVHFQHTSSKFVIRWSPVKGNWLIDWRGLNTDTVCSAVLLEDVPSPHVAKSNWRVFNGKEWVVDFDLKIENATECFKPYLLTAEESLLVGGATENSI